MDSKQSLIALLGQLREQLEKDDGTPESAKEMNATCQDLGYQSRILFLDRSEKKVEVEAR